MPRAPANLAYATDAMPSLIHPMLATAAVSIPDSQESFAFEFKWDGVRAISYFQRGELRLLSRNNLDITGRYPELADMTDIFGDRTAILDGEIIALDENDRPSFSLLQHRMHVNPRLTLRLANQIPVYYMIFDLLYLDGHRMLSLPYRSRRQMLENLKLTGPNWRIGPSIEGEGQNVLSAAQQTGMEGVVAKRLDSPYHPGRRSPDWLKIKIVQRQEFVVGGWCDQRGMPGQLGSLLLGYHDRITCDLHFAGSVGSGFSQQTLTEMQSLLSNRNTVDSPFAEPISRRVGPGCAIHFVNPDLVIDVDYRRWPRDGSIQQASYKGLRTDKRANEVFRED